MPFAKGALTHLEEAVLRENLFDLVLVVLLHLVLRVSDTFEQLSEQLLVHLLKEGLAVALVPSRVPSNRLLDDCHDLVHDDRLDTLALVHLLLASLHRRMNLSSELGERLSQSDDCEDTEHLVHVDHDLPPVVHHLSQVSHVPIHDALLFTLLFALLPVSLKLLVDGVLKAGDLRVGLQVARGKAQIEVLIAS